MINERIFYFVHGAVTMWFLVMGFLRISRSEPSRLKRMCGFILLCWGFLEVKDLAFYAVPVFRDNFISNLLVLIDMAAIPTVCGFIAELINTGWTSTKRVLLYLFPYILAIVLYAITESMWVFYGTFVYTVAYGAGFLVYLYFAIRSYNKMLSENYSNIEFLSVEWLQKVVVMLLAVFVVWTVSCYFSSWIIDSCYQLLLLTMWSMIIYYADRQQTPHSGDSPPPSNCRLTAF